MVATSTANASLVVTASLLDSNNATGDGGAISLLSGSAALTSSTVSNNVAGGDGGGLSIKVSAPSLVAANRMLTRSTLHAQGSAAAQLSSVVLLGNQASSFGGAVVLAGTSRAQLLAAQGVMAGNRALLGGGMALLSPHFAVRSVLIADNVADRGGAIDVKTDFAPAAAACAAAAASGVTCTSPLQDLNFTGYVGTL